MAAPDTKKRRSVFARVGAFFVWFVVPGIAIALAAAYVITALVWHVNPPVVPVSGGSMRPTLEPGDLVVLKGVDAEDIEVGDIIAVTVPDDVRRRYDLQTPVIHRVHKILRDPEEGLRFKTKGDANAGVDVFATTGPNIIGRMEKRLPGWGYPFLFFRSRQGLIFIAAAVFVIIMYFLIGVWDERRAAAQGAAISLYTVLQETRDIKETLETGRPPARGPPLDPSLDVPPTAPLPGPPRPPAGAAAGDDDVKPVLRELVSAIDYYGQHLQSHTGVMVNLAKTTAELYQAAVEIRRALGSQTDPDLPDVQFPPVIPPEAARRLADGDPEPSPAAGPVATPRRTPPPPPAAERPRRTTPPPPPALGTTPRRTPPPPPAVERPRRTTPPPPPSPEMLARLRTVPPTVSGTSRRTPPPPPQIGTRRRTPPPPPPAR